MKTLWMILIFSFLPTVEAIDLPIPVAKIEYKEEAPRRGWEERGPEWALWLIPSVRIGGGSGTMVYFDPSTKFMYIISCGHLFNNGYKGADEYKKNPRTREIDVFYHNEKKLDKPEKYTAEVLCHVCQVWERGGGIWDVSLMRFKPKWNNPIYAPIAPLNLKLVKGQEYHSVGCDGGSEIAHYLVEFQEERKRGVVTEYVTEKNGPRGGRSGGGVFTDDGHFFAICSRGSNTNNGGGEGYWSSLFQIYKFLYAENYEFILELPARKLPIKDMNNPQKEYPRNYIPIPRKAA